MATRAVENGIGTTAHRLTGVGGCEQQADHRAYGQIVEVISHKGRLCTVHPQLFLQSAEGGWLVLNTYEAMDDAQLLSPRLRRTSLATTKKGYVKSLMLK